MAQQVINNGETGLVVRGKINDNFTEVYGIAANPYPQVTDFASLPSAASNSGKIYIVQTTTGIIGFRKLAGMWRSDGANWNYLGLYGRNASEIVNVPAGTIVAVDVQAAVTELDANLTAHKAAGGTQHPAVTTSVNGFMIAADKVKLDGIATGATVNTNIASLTAANTNRFFGRITAASGPGEELTGTQATTLLDSFTSALKGLAPASGGGTTNFLRADGSWAVPAGGGSFNDQDYQSVEFRITSGSTAAVFDGGTLTAAGTVSFGGPQATTRFLAAGRKIYTSTATAGTANGIRISYGQFFRGNVASVGGFNFQAIFGQTVNLNGSQAFVGLKASTAALPVTAGAVLALTDCLGMGYDTTDASTGNWFFYRNDNTGSATRVDLGTGAARNATDGYRLRISCLPNDTIVTVEVVNLTTNTSVLSTTYNTDLPTANTTLAIGVEGNNGAVASATALSIADFRCRMTI
jgi:hypothetical protein